MAALSIFAVSSRVNKTYSELHG